METDKFNQELEINRNFLQKTITPFKYLIRL